MKLTDPVNIMLECCIPDKKKLLHVIGRMSPGQMLLIEIDNCITSKNLVESYLRNHLCRVVKVEERGDSNILYIQLDLNS